MNPTHCPRCRTEIENSPAPSFCTNCGAQLHERQPTKDQNNKDDLPNSTTKRPIQITSFIIPILVIVAFVIGLYTPKLFADPGNEITTTMSKSQLTSFFSVVNEEEITDTDLMFKGVKSELVTKESEEKPGTYEVTGEFTHDETTYTFTHEVFRYDGIYFYYDMPDFEE